MPERVVKKFPGVAVSMIVVLLVAVILLTVRTVQNSDTISYICTTNGALDALVVDAGDQIQVNFTNGTYARLLKQGIITPANVIAAHQTLVKYKHEHEILSHNGACR